MRNSFIDAIEKFATPETIVITGDLGFGVLDGFRRKFPKQFINAGVAEQNLTGMSAGLALEGKKVFTYSIANFNTLRAVEQIRNDIAYHNLNVTIVAVGGGLAYGALGITHHATEDIAILRAIPNLKVIAPGDTYETFEITKILLSENFGPVYLRLGRAGEATLHTDTTIQKLEIGKILPLINNVGSKIALLSTGGMLEISKKIHDGLNNMSIGSSVFSVHTIKPLDSDTVYNIFEKYDYIFTLEEHSRIGGLASAICESLIGKNFNLSKFTQFALPSEFTSIVGDQNFLRDYYGISAEKILNRIIQIVK
jgi:transketolase